MDVPLIKWHYFFLWFVYKLLNSVHTLELIFKMLKIFLKFFWNIVNKILQVRYLCHYLKKSIFFYSQDFRIKSSQYQIYSWLQLVVSFAQQNLVNLEEKLENHFFGVTQSELLNYFFYFLSLNLKYQIHLEKILLHNK